MTQDNEILSQADEFAALLPWYVSGKISAADKVRVESFLAAHPEAQKQLALAREEADEVFAANQSIVPPRDALDKLRASLAKSPSARLHAVEASLLDRFGVFLSSLSPRKLALAGVAAACAVALQTATIGALLQTLPGGGYETASGPKDALTGTFALVAFQPAAPAGTLSAFLVESGYTILEGPKAGGMYRLRVSSAILTDAERDALVEKLKARADLISFASAAPAAKGGAMKTLRSQLMHAAAVVTLTTLSSSLAVAQTRDTQGPAAGGAGTVREVPNVKLPPKNVPSVTVPDGPMPGGPSTDGPSNDGPRPDGGGSTAGLPDAVTILTILWGLPRPQFDGPASTSDYGPPERGPAPKGGTPPAVTPSLPLPVLTAAAGAPFVPKPVARPPTAPPVITGTVLPEVRDREVIVTLGSGSSAATVTELARDYGLRGDTLYTSALLGTRVVRLTIPDTRSIGDVLQQLSGDARIEVQQPNYVFTASGAAAATLPVPQYAIDKLRLGEAHKLARGKRVKIAVIDTGVDTAHPAFSGALHETYNALGASKDAPEAHGTSIAGIVGARAGFAGVAPDAELLSARAFSTTATGPAQSDTLAVLKSLDWAVSRGARVVNMSFAGPEDPLLGRAIAAAVKQGAVVIAAAGNGGPDAKPAYPGAFADVIAVSATDSADKLYDKANRGSYIAIAAPGVDIVAPAPKGAYDISSGTSLAAAHVSGITALMLEKEPKLTAADVRKRLAGAASNPDKAAADLVGAGIVDAAKALQAK